MKETKNSIKKAKCCGTCKHWDQEFLTQGVCPKNKSRDSIKKCYTTIKEYCDNHEWSEEE